MNILVTGAGGAVGSQIMRILTEEFSDVYHVIAIDLPCHKEQFNYNENVTFIPFDLNTNRFSIEPGLIDIAERIGIDGVINAAAIVDISKDYKSIAALNAALPDILANVFYDVPIVHISTGSIYKNFGEVITVDGTPLKSVEECDSAYEQSKLIAEQQILLRYNQLSNVTILRPSLIYGPKCRFLGAALAAIPPFVKQVSNSTIGFTGGPKTNWVHCEDVARACVASLVKMRINHLANKKSFNIYNVCDDVVYGFGDTISQYMEAYGLEVVHKIKIPSPKTFKYFEKFINNSITPKLCNGPINVAWKGMKFFHSLKNDLHVSVDKEMLGYLFNDMIFSNKEIKETGFEFKYPDSRLAIPEVLRWYKYNEWIPQ